MHTRPLVSEGTDYANVLRYILNADHGSVLEHIVCTFYLEGVSRSFLAQLTRHRMGSFTSASQHYSDYRDMPLVMSRSMADDYHIEEAMKKLYQAYIDLVDSGTPKEEARQILPNAAAVNILWTVNMRSLYNFFTQRLCYRNVAEMRIVATKLLHVVHVWWPEYAALCGPYCYQDNVCNQGKLSCGTMWRSPLP